MDFASIPNPVLIPSNQRNTEILRKLTKVS